MAVYIGALKKNGAYDIELISIQRISPRTERVEVFINKVKYFGHIITFGENWNKKYVQFLKRSPKGQKQAKFDIRWELEKYINDLGNRS